MEMESEQYLPTVSGLLDVIVTVCQDPSRVTAESLASLFQRVAKDAYTLQAVREKNALQGLRNNITRLQQERDRCLSDCGELRSQLKQCQAQRDAGAGSSNQRQESNEALQRQLEEVRTARQEAETKFAAARAEVESLTAHLRTADQLAADARAQKLALEEQMKEQEAELHRTRQELAANRDTLRQKSEVLPPQPAVVLKTQDDTLTERLDKASAENAVLRARLGELEFELRRAKEALAATVPPALSPSPGPPTSVMIVELGSWRIRCGVVPLSGGVNQDVAASFRSFPSFVARPKSEQADLRTIVQNAGLQAGPMYKRFREEGVFLGDDAWYCFYDHPDPALRSALKLDSPFARGGLIRKEDVRRLVSYAVDMLEVDAASTPVLVTYKSIATPKERQNVMEALFEHCEFRMVRLLNEAFLLSVNASCPTALVVDIGHESIHVVPVYEGLVVDLGVRTAPLGGSDLSKYMANMLLSRKNEAFTMLVAKKQVETARKIKEKHGYIALDFGQEVQRFGRFKREKVDVMSWQRPTPAGENGDDARRAPVAETGVEQEPVVYDTQVAEGKELVIPVGKERFHCPELLFTPDLQAADNNEDKPHENGVERGGHCTNHTNNGTVTGLVDLVLESLRAMEPDFWGDLLSNIVLAGGSSLFTGMAARLNKDLREKLPPKFAKMVKVCVLDSAASRDDGRSAVWRGAASVLPKLLSASGQLNDAHWLSVETYQQLGAASSDVPQYTGSL